MDFESNNVLYCEPNKYITCVSSDRTRPIIGITRYRECAFIASDCLSSTLTNVRVR